MTTRRDILLHYIQEQTEGNSPERQVLFIVDNLVFIDDASLDTILRRQVNKIKTASDAQLATWDSDRAAQKIQIQGARDALDTLDLARDT